MEVEDFWKLAEDATLFFSTTAASTAASTPLAIVSKRKVSSFVEISTRLGKLAAMLYIIHNTLKSPTPDEERIISKRIPKLLALLESLCTVSSPETWIVASFTHAAKGKAQSNMPEDQRLWYPNLRNIVSAKADQHDLATTLVEFATDKRETVERCFSRLKTFGIKGGSREKHEGYQAIEDLKAKIEEQASRVDDPGGGDQSDIHQAFYEALCCPCTCSSKTRQGIVCGQHWTRLQLYDSVATSQDKAIFDVVFSSNPAPSPGADVKWRWQQLRFEIPMVAKRNVVAEQKVESYTAAPPSLQASHTSLPLTQAKEDDSFPLPTRKKKGVRFVESVSPPTTDQRASFEELCYPLQAEDFCQLLKDDSSGTIRKRLRIEDGALHQMHDPAPPDLSIRSSPRTPLSEILSTPMVSSKDKIVLAYVLARATWQYYSSELMKVCWTSGSIHFIPEEALDVDDDGDQTKLDPSKPYFAFQFDGSDDPASIEFCDSRDVLHRYPRILALALLLTELGYPKGGFKRNTARNLQEQINNDWKSVQTSLVNKKWPSFGLRNPQITDTYRVVVKQCLDHRAFHVSSSAGSKEYNHSVEQRRAILYKNVVHPLDQLLSDSGLVEEDAEPKCEGEGRSNKDEDILQTLAYEGSRYAQFKSESRRHEAQSHISCSASLLPAVDTFPGSSVRHRPLYTEYTVGWICAVQVEKVAARELLEEDYAPPAFNSAHDNNIYGFGRIGQHKVVIASLPKGRYGIAFAAAAARDMLRSFPSIKFGLMVGIAGGAPSANHDVRLGDIVVSSPDRHSGGVIHYDFGKAIQSKEFQRTGSQNGPPVFLLNAVHDLSAQHECKGHQIEQTAALVVERNPRLKCKYKRPSPETDRLYNSAYLHEDDSKSCKEACDQGKTKLQTRPYRDKTTIHYGLIASADKLMKDAQVRDALAEKEGILCFEMEAAGLMDHFPCLVIRGICDYSDTHKNDAWQGYAAVAAAAYAKELLEMIPPAEIQAS